MSVFKRFNGKKITSKHPKYTEARWYVYKRVKGHKTIHQPIPEARTKEQAETAERKLIDDLFNRTFGVPDNATTFAQFADGKYKSYVMQRNVNLVAKNLYIRILKEHFKSRPLTSITPQDCRDLQHRLQHRKNERKKGGKLSPSSVNRIMSTLSKLFRLACEEGVLMGNPMQYVRPLKEPPPRKRLLTEKEKESFWNELAKDDYMRRIVLLAINLPLRRAQILALSKRDVDFDRRVLWVIESKNRPPRCVVMNDTATRVLSELCSVSRDRLFPLGDFRKRWSRMLVRAGINKEDGTREENFHFHDLRTEFASELLRNNVNPEIVRRLFAHSSMAITQGYMETETAQLFDAVKSLDERVENSDVVQ